MPDTRADISITDVARKARVSLGTVSRVFNRHPRVASELRRRVYQSSRALGFVPKIATRRIGVLTGRRSPALPVGYTSIMTALVSRFLADREYVVELIDADHLDLVWESPVEGIIGIVFDDRLAELREVPSLPLLTINHPMTQHGIHSIRTDHFQQGFLATQHLISHGHRSVGFLAIEANEWGSAERLRGCRAAMREAGLELAPNSIAYTTDRPVYDVLTRWVRQGVTAILNFSEDAGLEVIHIAANILGRRIGHDLSIICLEDLSVYQYLTPPMTTVRQPLEEAARIAVAKMLELCGAKARGGSAEQPLDICLPTELIERDSVATIRSA